MRERRTRCEGLGSARSHCAVLSLVASSLALLGPAVLRGHRAEAAIATPGDNGPTFTRVRMVAFHRKGVEMLVVHPELDLRGAAAREVTVRGDVDEMSTRYGEPMRAPIAVCNAGHGDRAGTVVVRRGKEDAEPSVEAEGPTEAAIRCMRSVAKLPSPEDLPEGPDVIEIELEIAPDPSLRPSRLAWVLPVKGLPLHFGRLPPSVVDEVAEATEEILPAAPPGASLEGLPRPTRTGIDGSVDLVPGTGERAIRNLGRLLAEGGFGSIPDDDTRQYAGDWSFLLVRSHEPPPLVGSLDPVAVTFRTEKLVLPARIYGRGRVRDTRIFVYSDRIVAPEALLPFGLVFRGASAADDGEDGVDYVAKHVPRALADVLRSNARVAPELVPLAERGAAYRLDGVPMADRPPEWSEELEVAFARHPGPRDLPDHVPPREAAAPATGGRGGCGCTATPSPGAVTFAFVTMLAVRRKRTRGGG